MPLCKSIKYFFKSVIYGHKRIFKADKSQTEGARQPDETQDAGHSRTHGERPLPGQLPKGRFRKRRATPVAESEKAVLGADRCGRAVRDITLRKKPPLQLRQIRAGGLQGESGQRPHIRARPELGRRSEPDRHAPNAALCMGEVLPGFRQD